MEWWLVFVRTLFTYFIVFLVLRLMGKREIGKLSVFDLVISIMIAEIAVILIEDTGKPLWGGLIPIATLMCVQMAIAFITLKFRGLREVFDGSPSVIIQNGKLVRKEMRKQKYNLDDLMLQLRQNNITNVADVEFAILESTGKLTVVEKKDFENGKKPPAKIRYEGLPLPLIMDGKVQDDQLQRIGKTRFWLKNQIQSHGVSDFKEVFLCTMDHKGDFYVDRMKKH